MEARNGGADASSLLPRIVNFPRSPSPRYQPNFMLNEPSCSIEPGPFGRTTTVPSGHRPPTKRWPFQCAQQAPKSSRASIGALRGSVTAHFFGADFSALCPLNGGEVFGPACSGKSNNMIAPKRVCVVTCNTSGHGPRQDLRLAFPFVHDDGTR